MISLTYTNARRVMKCSVANFIIFLKIKYPIVQSVTIALYISTKYTIVYVLLKLDYDGLIEMLNVVICVSSLKAIMMTEV